MPHHNRTCITHPTLAESPPHYTRYFWPPRGFQRGPFSAGFYEDYGTSREFVPSRFQSIRRQNTNDAERCQSAQFPRAVPLRSLLLLLRRFSLITLNRIGHKAKGEPTPVHRFVIRHFAVSDSNDHVRVHERLIGNLHKRSHCTGIDMIVEVHRSHPL